MFYFLYAIVMPPWLTLNVIFGCSIQKAGMAAAENAIASGKEGIALTYCVLFVLLGNIKVPDALLPHDNV